MKTLKILVGAIVGLLLGAVLGFVAAAWWSTRGSPSPVLGQGVGWDPISLLQVPVFQVMVVLCALAFGYLFAYLFGRIGRRKQHARV